MNWDQIQGKWKQVKGQVQQKWGDLTNDDLDVVDGKREELVGKVQARYGIAKEEAEKAVESGEFWSNQQYRIRAARSREHLDNGAEVNLER